MTCSSLPTSSELSLFNHTRPVSLGVMRNILFFGAFNFQGSCGLVYHSTDPLCFKGRIFECFCGKFFSCLCFMLTIKKKKAKLACFPSLLPADDQGWWLPGRPRASPVFIFKISISQKPVATFQLLHRLFRRWSAFTLGLQRGLSSFQVPGLWVSCFCNLPAWTVLAGSGHSRGLSGMKEGRKEPTFRASQACFSWAGCKFLWSRAERGLVLSWQFVSSPKARILTMEEY